MKILICWASEIFTFLVQYTVKKIPVLEMILFEKLQGTKLYNQL